MTDWRGTRADGTSRDGHREDRRAGRRQTLHPSKKPARLSNPMPGVSRPAMPSDACNDHFAGLPDRTGLGSGLHAADGERGRDAGSSSGRTRWRLLLRLLSSGSRGFAGAESGPGLPEQYGPGPAARRERREVPFDPVPSRDALVEDRAGPSRVSGGADERQLSRSFVALKGRRGPKKAIVAVAASPTPSLCGDSLQGLQGRLESLPQPARKGPHAGALHREPRIETCYLGSHLGKCRP